MDPLPQGTDQIIDAAMARALHADACREHALVAWVVLWDPVGTRRASLMGLGMSRRNAILISIVQKPRQNRATSAVNAARSLWVIGWSCDDRNRLQFG